MKKIAIVSIFIMLSFNGMSQDNEPLDIFNYSGLLNDLKNSKTDSVRLKRLVQLANYHKFNQPDSGVYYATKGFKLAQDIGDKKRELEAVSFLALSYHSLGNSVTAYRIGLEALRKAEEDDQDMKGEVYRVLGMIMNSSQNFEKSREYFLKAKDEFYRNNRQSSLATVYASLGVLNGELGNIDSAFYYGHRAIAIAESLNHNVAKDVAYDRIGNTHLKIQNIDSAFYYYRLSYSVRSERRIGPSILRKIAYMYNLNEQRDSALYYAEKSLDRAYKNRLFEDVSESALFFSEFYEKSDPSKAITYYKMALAYNDSLEYRSKMTGFADLINFDELQRQSELERANEAYKSKLRTNTFVGSIFTLLVVAFFLFKNNRSKHKAKLQIEEAYNQLKSTQSQLIQSEKMASLGELTAGIAHEIQNPLNFVNNFSEVSNELIDEMNDELDKGAIEEAKAISADIKQNLEKINHHGKRADAIVKGMLAHSRSGSGEKVPTDINALADEYLRLSYHGLRARDKSFNADFSTNLDPTLPKVKVVPQDIGRVLLNLINNAFQACATEGIKNPTVTVSTKQIPEGIEITVQDNGPGIPEQIRDKIFQPFFTTKPTGQGTGLGLSLSYDIVKAHGGELTVLSEESKGSTFIIQIPKN